MLRDKNWSLVERCFGFCFFFVSFVAYCLFHVVCLQMRVQFGSHEAAVTFPHFSFVFISVYCMRSCGRYSTEPSRVQCGFSNRNLFVYGMLSVPRRMIYTRAATDAHNSCEVMLKRMRTFFFPLITRLNLYCFISSMVVCVVTGFVAPTDSNVIIQYMIMEIDDLIYTILCERERVAQRTKRVAGNEIIVDLLLSEFQPFLLCSHISRDFDENDCKKKKKILLFYVRIPQSSHVHTVCCGADVRATRVRERVACFVWCVVSVNYYVQARFAMRSRYFYIFFSGVRMSNGNAIDRICWSKSREFSQK